MNTKRNITGTLLRLLTLAVLITASSQRWIYHIGENQIHVEMSQFIRGLLTFDSEYCRVISETKLEDKGYAKYLGSKIDPMFGREELTVENPGIVCESMSGPAELDGEDSEKYPLKNRRLMVLLTGTANEKKRIEIFNTLKQDDLKDVVSQIEPFCTQMKDHGWTTLQKLIDESNKLSQRMEADKFEPTFEVLSHKKCADPSAYRKSTLDKNNKSQAIEHVIDFFKILNLLYSKGLHVESLLPSSFCLENGKLRVANLGEIQELRDDAFNLSQIISYTKSIVKWSVGSITDSVFKDSDAVGIEKIKSAAAEFMKFENSISNGQPKKYGASELEQRTAVLIAALEEFYAGYKSTLSPEDTTINLII